MKIQYQLAQANAEDWVTCDHTLWYAIPTNQYVLRINCMGISFKGDHLAIEEIEGGIRIHAWNDDPLQYYPGKYEAHCRDITPLTEEDGIYIVNAPITLFMHDDFVNYTPPPAYTIRHSIQLSNEEYEAHAAFESLGYMDWVEE